MAHNLSLCSPFHYFFRHFHHELLSPVPLNYNYNFQSSIPPVGRRITHLQCIPTKVTDFRANDELELFFTPVPKSAIAFIVVPQLKPLMGSSTMYLVPNEFLEAIASSKTPSLLFDSAILAPSSMLLD